MMGPILQLLVLTLATACTSSTSTCDVSTEKGALAVYGRLTGHDGTTGCVELRPKFPGLAYVGYVVPDAGCMGMIMIWQCRKGSAADVPAILQAAGWKVGGDSRRLEIARDWLDGSGLWGLGGTVLWEETDEVRKAFPDDSQTFSPARLTAHNGGVHVEGWLVEYPMTIAGPQLAYARFAADFSADGKVVTRIGEWFRRAPRLGPALRQSVPTELGFGTRDADSLPQRTGGYRYSWREGAMI